MFKTLATWNCSCFLVGSVALVFPQFALANYSDFHEDTVSVLSGSYFLIFDLAETS